MLVREDQNKKVGHVEFMSYTGKYPNLCMGILTLKIDGEIVTFGNFFSNKVDYPEFWATGGSRGLSSGFPEGYVNRGEWLIYESELPTEYKAYVIEIEKDCDIEVTEQTKINLAPRLRMLALYAVSQSLNGRVVNTCNYSEDYVGYSTRYGDSAGDFSPLGDFTVSEVKCIGRALGLPNRFIEKIPSDGLCGKSDEDNLGFTYDTLDRYIREGIYPEEDVAELIDKKHENNIFKLKTIPVFRQDVTYEFGEKIMRHFITYEWR